MKTRLCKGIIVAIMKYSYIVEKLSYSDGKIFTTTVRVISISGITRGMVDA